MKVFNASRKLSLLFIFLTISVYGRNSYATDPINADCPNDSCDLLDGGNPSGFRDSGVTVHGARPIKPPLFQGVPIVGGNQVAGGGGGGTRQPSPKPSAPYDPNQDGMTHHQEPCPTQHPVVVSSGNKVKDELDFETYNLNPVYLKRYYNHSASSTNMFGPKWASNLDRHLAFKTSSNTYCEFTPGSTSIACPAASITGVVAIRSDGAQLTYTFNSSSSRFESPSLDANNWIVHNGDGTWTIQNNIGSYEVYSSVGAIQKDIDQYGIGSTFNYSGGYLQSVTHTTGSTITLTWSGNTVATVTDPASQKYSYAYTGGYLTSVTYPGNPSIQRKYFYEDSSHPEALTGISVNGIRYSTYSYLASGQVNWSGLLDGSVEKDTFTYSANQTKVTNAGGATSTYSYQTINGMPMLISLTQTGLTNCPDTTVSYHYDSNGHVDSRTNARGIKSTFITASNGMVTDQILGIDSSNKQRETQYVWDSKNRLKTVTRLDNASQPVVSYSYSYYPDQPAANGRLKSVVVTNLSNNGVNGQTQTTNYSYSLYSSGLVSQIVVTGVSNYTLNYDSTGNMTSALDGLGHSTTYSSYNGLGLPATITDPNGYAISYQYDFAGRPTSISRTLDGTSATTTFSYDGLGDVLQTTYTDGSYIKSVYDGAGRMTSMTTDLSETANTKDTASEQFAYNNLSKVTSDQIIEVKRNAFNQVTSTVVNTSHTWSYDSLGRVLISTGANGQTLSFKYDANGNISSTTDALNRATTYTYNSNDEVETITDPSGGVTRIAYDWGGNVISIVDPKNLATLTNRDGFGQISQLNSSDTGITNYNYDSQGRLTATTRNDGSQETWSNFDALNRPGQYSNGSDTFSYTYDSGTNAVGRISQITSSSSGSMIYAYRQNGQLITQNEKIGTLYYKTFWSYDNRDRLSTITYSGGNIVHYNYGTSTRPTGVTVQIGSSTYNVISGVTFASAGLGPITQITMADGSVVSRSFDQDTRLVNLSTPSIQSHTYSYDAANQLSGVTNNLSTNYNQTFSHDGAGRLSNVTSNGFGNHTYTYDAIGNRTSDSYGSVDTYSYAGYNTLLSQVTGGHTFYYGYDVNGNTSSITKSGFRSNITHDHLGRLSSFTGQSGTTSYTYNIDNKRVTKSGPSGNVRYIYTPGAQLIGETTDFSTTILPIQYIYFQGQVVGLIKSGVLYSVFNDHLGRPEVITNTSKAIVWQASNAAFDRSVATSSIGDFNIGFPGQYFDAESGLYYNLNRYYDPSTGRYIEPDPLGKAAGPNIYSYASSNPVTNVDPFGLCPQQCEGQGRAPTPSQYQRLGQQAANLSVIVPPVGVLLNFSNLYDFHRGGALDAQVRYEGSQAYANYVFGVYLSASGASLDFTLGAANAYGYLFANYPANWLASSLNKYPSIPIDNVANITQGYADQQNGTLCIGF